MSVGSNTRVNTSTLEYSGVTNTTVNSTSLTSGNVILLSDSISLGLVNTYSNSFSIGNSSSNTLFYGDFLPSIIPSTYSAGRGNENTSLSSSYLRFNSVFGTSFSTRIATQNIFANGSSGTAGQVLYSNGTGVYWDLRPGNLSIGNLVYVMFFNEPSYYMARGWAYKSSKTSNIATIYIKFFDYYSTSSISPNWGSVGTANTNSAWTLLGSSSSVSAFATSVSNKQLYGLDFYSGYNYAGSTSIMPASPSSASGAITLKYPSGGLAAYTVLPQYGNYPSTDSTWGYVPSNYITFSYSLDGTLDSRISTFNYP